MSGGRTFVGRGRVVVLARQRVPQWMKAIRWKRFFTVVH
jgi:hypothetical protein